MEVPWIWAAAAAEATAAPTPRPSQGSIPCLHINSNCRSQIPNSLHHSRSSHNFFSLSFLTSAPGSSHCSAVETNAMVTMRLRIWSLALFSGLSIQHCCELWCRPAAVAPVRPLAWDHPFVSGLALKSKKKAKKKKKFCTFFFFFERPKGPVSPHHWRSQHVFIEMHPRLHPSPSHCTQARLGHLLVMSLLP